MTAGALAPPVKHALLRSGAAWPDVDLAGLDVRPDGALELERVPAVVPPWDTTPGSVPHSGIAVDERCRLYVTDGPARRVERIAVDCAQTLVAQVSGTPGGIAVGPHGWVLVTDAAGGRILVLTAGLRARGIWERGLTAPAAVASDRRRIAVLDRRPEPWLVLLDAAGMPTAAWPVPNARALAIDGDAIYVATGGGVRRFAPDGGVLEPVLPGQAIGAVAVAAGILLAADDATGEVARVRLADGRRLGSVAGFRGPVAALAARSDGGVYIKPGADATWRLAIPRAGRVRAGTLTAGPLDAGEDNGWVRAAARVHAAPGTSARLQTATSAGSAGPPAWRVAAATDTLVAPGRFLWLRVTLEREGDADATPVVDQVAARTPGGSYFEHLPAVYSRDATTAAAVGPFLALAQSLFDDLEDEIADVAQRTDAATAPAEALAQLGAWQAFDVPRELTAGRRWEDVRDLLSELPELLPRQGTLAGVARLVEIATGVRPRLFETFRERHVWLLGGRAALGFDTGLLSTAVEGLVLGESRVGTSGPEDPETWGAALFADLAHLFTATAPAGRAAGREAAVRAALDAHKPAHTDYHLCLVEPRLRVGLQARLGIDAIVAGDEGIELGERGRLDIDGRTAADDPDAPGSVGRKGRLGLETRVA